MAYDFLPISTFYKKTPKTESELSCLGVIFL